jgi:hypothetical protein
MIILKSLLADYFILTIKRTVAPNAQPKSDSQRTQPHVCSTCLLAPTSSPKSEETQLFALSQMSLNLHGMHPRQHE